MNAMDLAYRTTAAAGASGLSLLIALYDTLGGDLRRAAAAQRAGNLEQRCREINHAIAILGVLEHWTDRNSGELAQMLMGFYAKLRRRMIEAQARQSAEMLAAAMSDVLNLREQWQKLEAGSAPAASAMLPPVAMQYGGDSERRRMSWSA